MIGDGKQFSVSKGLHVGLVVVLLFLALAPVGNAAPQQQEAPQADMSAAWRLPFVRMGHSAVLDPGASRMIVFGGWNGQQFFNDVWALDVTTPGSEAWTKLNPSGAWPPPRGMHSAIYDSEYDRMIVFGGRGFHYNFDDVWALDLSTPGAETWTQLQPSGPAIPARRWHTAIYDRAGSRMIVFGGGGGSGLLNDVWALDLTPGAEAWSQVPVTGSVPAARWQHTAINTSDGYDPGRMIVFGGAAAGGALRNDAWELDLATGQWTQLAPGETRPAARRGHTAILSPQWADQMVIFGGLGESGFLNDTWRLDVTPGEVAWTQLGPTGGPPAPRAWHAAIRYPAHSRMYVTGGRGMGSLEGETQWDLNYGGMAWMAIWPTLPDWWQSGAAARVAPTGGVAVESPQAGGRPEVTLQIEDAAPNVAVNLLSDAELEVWFVVKISTTSSTYKNDVDVTITLPTAKFNSTTVRAGTRTSDASPTPTWTTPQNLGGGQYRLNDVDLQGSSSSGYSIQVVFKANPIGNVTGSQSITARALGPNWQATLESTATARFYSDPQVWIVTNRKLLLDKYVDSEVFNLLKELYELGLSRTAVVLYAERYLPSLQTWNNTAVDYTNETTANPVADSLADWLVDRVVSWSPSPTFAYPEYTVIVGDDNIIPRYRKKDYADIPNGEITHPTCYGQEPLCGTLVSHNYFWTDNPYGDQEYGSVHQDWETGELEAAVGRIVGASAADMQHAVENGALGPNPAENEAIIASGNADCMDWEIADPDAVSVIHDNLAYTVDLSLVDSAPNKTKVVDEMKEGFAVAALAHHGEVDVWDVPGGVGPGWEGGCAPGRLGSWEMPLYDPSHLMPTNRPYFYFNACRVGISYSSGWDDPNCPDDGPQVYDDSMVYALVHQGVSGVTASGGLTYYLPGNGSLGPSELLSNDFWYVVQYHPDQSDPLGWSLMRAKSRLSIAGSYEKKTVQEFTYFGLPWMRLPGHGSRADALAIPKTDATAEEWSIAAKPDSSYVVTATIDASTYAISTTVEGFDLIEVTGLSQRMTSGRPVLPQASLELVLPLSATLTSLTFTPTQEVVLPNLDIPTPVLGVGLPGGPSGGYTTTLDGVYPVTATFESHPQDTYQLIRVNVIPVTYDATQDQATLYRRVDLEVQYDTPKKLALTYFEPDKTQFVPGEAIGAASRLINAGDVAETVTATLILQDHQGQIVGFKKSAAFAVPAGGSYDLHLDLAGPLDGDTYLLRLLVWQAGQVVAGAGRPILVTAGQIADLTVPQALKPREDGTFTVTFDNLEASSTLATVSLAIYDANGAPVGFPEPQTASIPGGNSATLTFHWTPERAGSYVASAVVSAGRQEYGPLIESLEVSYMVYLPLVHRAH